MNDQTQEFIIDLLIKHEEALGSLYTAYSQQFPIAEEFWKTIAIEERAHADVLRQLIAPLKYEMVLMNTREFNSAGLWSSIDYVRQQEQHARSGSCTLEEALATALNFERAIIDRSVFQVFDSDMPAMKLEFEALKKHTAEHIARIAEKQAQLRTNTSLRK